jgi:DNA-binding MarR family transcriptional regulator
VKLQLVPALHRATHGVALFLDASSPSLRLTQGECHLLAHLHESGAAPVGALHAAFAHKRSTLTSYLDRLERAGLIRRALRPEDRRSFLVSLTAAGRAAAAKVHRLLAGLEGAALSRINARDVRGFHAVLQALQGAAADARNRRKR